MRDERAIDWLPSMYAEVLRLREQGDPTEAIAVQLGIEPEGVEPLVQVARAKLAALGTGDGLRAPSPEHGPGQR